MSLIANIVQQIRTAVYGRDVREAIASGIEQCYSDIHSAATIADQVTTEAGLARDAAQAAADSMVERLEHVQEVSDELDYKLHYLNSTVAEQNNKINTISTTLTQKVDDAMVENNSLYLLSNGNIVAGPFSGFGGGGGGGIGTGGSIKISVTDRDKNPVRTIVEGTSLILHLNWYSIEEDQGIQKETGNGSLKVTVNGISRISKTVKQGNFDIDVSEYLTNVDNTVQVRVTDIYNYYRVLNFTITTVSISIASTFDPTIIQTGVTTFPYTCYGDLEKTIHFKIDGVDAVNPVVTERFGIESRKDIPAQSHGAHTLDVYFTVVLNGETVPSNVLHYEVIWIKQNENAPIIASSFNQFTVDQYSTINIPFLVYNPLEQLTDVSIYVGGELYIEYHDVDRTEQPFSYRIGKMEFGQSNYTTLSIMFVCGTTSKTLLITVNKIGITADAATDGLKLFLSSDGRSNKETNPATWSYTDANNTTISATFSGFNWINDGWQIDDDGLTALRLRGDARITIPYTMFGSDKKGTGFTLEVEFATRGVRNYNSPIFSCISSQPGDNVGFSMTAQKATLTGQQAEVSAQYKEDEHIRISYVIEKQSSFHRIFTYINAVMCGAPQYEINDSFMQLSPVGISIGTNDCITDLYHIRIYDTDLTSEQIEKNWIADTQDGELMLARYYRNNVRDSKGNIVIDKLPSNLGYMIINCPVLPQAKKDVKICSGSYVDPEDPSKSFEFENAEIDVQGTSSQFYYRKNYKIKMKGGFIDSAGETHAKWSFRNNAIPVSTYCLKADVASSEGANNVELARLYNEVCPYKTPAQQENDNVRQGIDGFPIVVFWSNPTTNTVSFLGKYNFNNDKSTEDVFGFVEGDESWEMKRNTSDMANFKDSDFTKMETDPKTGETSLAWKNDFEARYPDIKPVYEDYTQLKALLDWFVSVDPEQATNSTLSSAVTYNGTRYTKDTAAYRKAKFKAELGNYMEINSVLFYYIFTETFLMVDSRAKNMFPSFMGTVLQQGG